MKVSAKFEDGAAIPDQYSGYGENISPGMEWSGSPKEAKQFALLMDDPDAPGTAFVHWSAVNIEGDSLPDGASKETLNGKNDAGSEGYTGPKPEAGPDLHHYRIRLFALDGPVDLKPGYDPGEFEVAVSGHVLALGELTGTYRRHSP
jgi:Raf kinase inhibitor-like YbhB/YbcL family protein